MIRKLIEIFTDSVFNKYKSEKKDNNNRQRKIQELHTRNIAIVTTLTYVDIRTEEGQRVHRYLTNMIKSDLEAMDRLLG